MAKPHLDFVAVLRALALELPSEARVAFVAQLERRAAKRYQHWAARAESPLLAAGFRLCAAREDGIAEIADATFPPPDDTVPLIEAALERASVATASVHDGRPLAESLAIQAAAERAGAATWRSLLGKGGPAMRRAALETCARLEEESAEFLERILASGVIDGERSDAVEPRVSQ